MINFSLSHLKKLSAVEPSAQTSAMSSFSSSLSSFENPVLSKDHDCGRPLEMQNQTECRRGQRRQKPSTCTNQHESNDSSKSQHLIDDSTTNASGTGPIVAKAVNFQKTARVRRVRPRKMYTKQEQEAMWYNDNDYADIKRQAVETVKRMIKGEKTGGFVDDDNFTARGLECRMKKIAVQRKEIKVFARRLVLEEQEDQNGRGIKSSDRIRKVYLKASSLALMKAQDAGLKDAKAVNDMSLSEILRILNLEHNNS